MKVYFGEPNWSSCWLVELYITEREKAKRVVRGISVGWTFNPRLKQSSFETCIHEKILPHLYKTNIKNKQIKYRVLGDGKP